MSKTFKPGLVHCPVTPFRADHGVDYDTYAKVIEFHLKHGAEALALPMPEGEDMSLRDPELRQLLEFALKQVAGRVPVIAHVSDAGTAIAVDRAKHAERAGAAALVTHPPYFWHPKPSMIVEHIAAVCGAVKLPCFVATPTIESVGATLTSGMVLDLIGRVPNLQGVIDGMLEFVFMEEVMSGSRELRPGFQLIAGQDYFVPAFALGGSGAVAPLAAIAPNLVRRVYELCRQQKLVEAREGQEQIAALNHLLRNAGHSGLKDGLAGIKRAMGAMGREVGVPRPPVKALAPAGADRVDAELRGMAFLAGEPRGW